MIRSTLALLVPLLALAACTSVIDPVPGDAPVAASVSSTEILVTVPQPVSPAAGLTGAPGQSYLLRPDYGLTPSVDRRLDRIARDYGLKRVRGWSIDSIGVYCEVFETARGQDSRELITKLLDDPRIDLAQPMNYFETLAQTYDDPLLDLQTSVTDLALDDAHQIATGRGVTIAVIDSQIDARHPDLRGRIHGVHDLVERGPGHLPEVHGTAIAGVIASVANNHEGIVGIAPDAEIVALRACWSTTTGGSGARCSSFSLALALELALRLDTEVINMSLAGPQDPLIESLIDEALERGIVVVAAKSSDDSPALGFPASHSGVIAAQTASDDPQASDSAVIYAPGREILSTAPQSAYAFFSGDSLAAAHVSGVVALLRERAPEMPADAVARLLRETGNFTGNRQSINACHALARLTRSTGCADASVGLATGEGSTR